MLATSGMPDGGLSDWAVEPKLDGWRVGVAVVGARLSARSRPGRVLTALVPELGGLAGLGCDAVLDGELIAGAGRMSDFYRLSASLAGPSRFARREPLRFVAFDLLWLDGVELAGRRYAERRAALESLELDPEVASVVPAFPGGDVHDLLAACAASDLEGVVLKRVASTYRAGRRSTDWRKVKCEAWARHAERRRPAERPKQS